MFKIIGILIILTLILSDIVYSNNYPFYSILILVILVLYYAISPKIR